jgi:CBS domain-containing protein
MPISHADMTAAERAAVAATMAATTDAVGNIKYDLCGNHAGPQMPIVSGRLQRSVSGAPWVNFGGNIWYRYSDTSEALIVLDPDGAPLGIVDEGPLVLVNVHGGPVAVTVNTGFNLEHEIKWG